ncbi:hypothetical protein B2J93_3583 [Marssonina coronariae]|uniref:Myb-like domain-containing protein n=1 Tax=Diplocarpon coronariae TaxID=2795749 RepID=A0A218Z244_9HELO|nr:hypothetical protein B2J93_3583 [Marssonina coronariae]
MSVDLATPTGPGISLGDLIADEEVNFDMSPTVTIEAPQTIPEDVSEAVIPTETPKKNVAMSKGPRKTPVKKSKAEAAVHVSDDMPAEPTEGGAEITTPAKPVKKPRKTPVKKENVKPATCKEGEEAGSADEPTTPKAAAPKKRAPKKKADPVTPGTPGEDADMMATTPPGRGATKSSVKKRAAVKAADDETPTKKAKAAAGDISGKRTKTAAERFPESWSDFSEQDKLIVNMKKSGKPWPEIESAWTAITRVAPGKDSLRKRFAKLAAVAVEFDEDDLPKIAAAKKMAEQETAAALEKMKQDQASALKKLNNEKWAKIAEHVKDAGGQEYTALMMERKWTSMDKNKQLDGNGDYIGAAAEEMESLSVADEAATNGNGNTEAEEADAMEA